MSRYLNVFHSYSQGETGDIEREKVLENNVTRALMVTLRNAPEAGKYVLNRLLGIEGSDSITYDLQTELGTFSDSTGLEKKWRRKFVLAIATQKERRQFEIADCIVQQVNRISGDETGRKKLQKLLVEANAQKRGAKGSSTAAAEMADLLGVEIENIIALDSSDLGYLYDLTFGSRPDAIITDSKAGFAALIESKIHGPIVEAQIARHVRRNYGDDQQPAYNNYGETMELSDRHKVPVCVCTWRHIYSLFNLFHKEGHRQGDGKADFVIEQFLEYLEDNNMGELKFTQQDFLDWEKLPWGSEEAWTHAHNLLSRLHSLGDSLAGHLGGNHWVNDQVPTRNYIGVNIVYGGYPKDKHKPVDVPHWSLAVEQHGASDRCLRLFVQCEGVGLTRRLLRQRELKKSLADVLGHISDQRSLTLRVEQKLFVAPGGKAKKENLWTPLFVFPLEASDENGIKTAVDEAFRVWAFLNDPNRRKKIIQDVPGGPHGKTVCGVLQVSTWLNWFELEKLGADTEKRLKETVDRLKPYYEVLLTYAANTR